MANSRHSWLWYSIDGPGDLPQWVWMHLVNDVKVNPDSLQGLKCVEQVSYVDEVLATLIRIFDPRAAEKAGITDFASLDRYPELILYEGYMEKLSGKAHLQPKATPAAKCMPPQTGHP